MHSGCTAGVLCDGFDAVRIGYAKSFQLYGGFYWLMPAFVAMLFPNPAKALCLLDERRSFPNAVIPGTAAKLAIIQAKQF